METIEIKVTWSGLLPMMLEVIENGTGDKQDIREEFAKMARGADALVALRKETKNG